MDTSKPVDLVAEVSGLRSDMKKLVRHNTLTLGAIKNVQRVQIALQMRQVADEGKIEQNKISIGWMRVGLVCIVVPIVIAILTVL